MCVFAHTVHILWFYNVTWLLRGRILQGQRVNQQTVSHTAGSEGPRGERGVSEASEVFVYGNRTFNFMVAFCLFWICHTQFLNSLYSTAEGLVNNSSS